MSLGISHGCFDGSYGSFTAWRRALALAAGLPPLDMMDGYYHERELDKIGDPDLDRSSWNEDSEWFVRAGSERVPASISQSLSPTMRRVISALPLSWDYFKSDPLTILLTHSDCEGVIEHKHLKLLADRLRDLLPRFPPLPEGSTEWPNFTARARTLRFIEGLMRAHELGENVEFR